GVCYWDLIFTDGPEERDSSGAAIAVCGLLELAKQLPVSDPNRRGFEKAAVAILRSLIDHYAIRPDQPSNGLIKHGVYHKSAGKGVNECCIWGDYFYLEALVRMLLSWKPYW
ncbi:MAG TPA: glucuronyl hydrolase, partial [Bacillota bacterium]|nr:glucuronyl hydrolase [Bacillota bacterium]